MIDHLVLVHAGMGKSRGGGDGACTRSGPAATPFPAST
ncbi:immune inhibitor A [Micromonospora globispora]|nr:immune inhibitor A [Micromonospora globispora]